MLLSSDTLRQDSIRESRSFVLLQLDFPVPGVFALPGVEFAFLYSDEGV